MQNDDSEYVNLVPSLVKDFSFPTLNIRKELRYSLIETGGFKIHHSTDPMNRISAASPRTPISSTSLPCHQRSKSFSYKDGSSGCYGKLSQSSHSSAIITELETHAWLKDQTLGKAS
jgi:hypothetical protein